MTGAFDFLHLAYDPVPDDEMAGGLQILRDIGVRTMRLMTNNPSKYVGLKGYGLAISGRVPLLTPITAHNRRYLETKHKKLGHLYGPESGAGSDDASSSDA